MNHIDIFTGIGGWPLGLSWAFGKEYNPIVFCEIDPFCQKILRKHWPDVPIEDNISNMKGEEFAEKRVDILTTSPPCQPYSQAGLRRGSEDDRAIWPAVIEFVRKLPQPPRWICVENVRGFINIEEGLAFEQTITDLENLGYEVQPFIIPACSVKAPHQRERVWIIAYTKQPRTGNQDRETCNKGWRTSKTRSESIRQGDREASSSGSASTDCYAPDTKGAGQLRTTEQENNGKDRKRRRGYDSADKDSNHAPDTPAIGLHSEENQQVMEGKGSDKFHAVKPGDMGRQWDEPWLEAATRLCSVDDGVPGGLVRPRGWRKSALKAAGNAVVPHIPYAIGLAIQDANSNEGN